MAGHPLLCSLAVSISLSLMIASGDDAAGLVCTPATRGKPDGLS